MIHNIFNAGLLRVTCKYIYCVILVLLPKRRIWIRPPPPPLWCRHSKHPNTTFWQHSVSFSKHEGRPPQATDRPVKYDESPCKESIIIKSSLFGGRLPPPTAPPHFRSFPPFRHSEMEEFELDRQLCLWSYWTSCIISRGLYNHTCAAGEFEECSSVCMMHQRHTNIKWKRTA